ncbi:unnamed protein product, partial [Staurois parvus]
CFASAVPLLSSAFLAVISSASWQQSHQHSWQQSHQHSWQQSLVTEGCSHTWMSSDSQLTWPPSFTILQNMAALSPLCENSTS